MDGTESQFQGSGADEDIFSGRSVRPSPIKPFKASQIGRGHPSSPTFGNALHDGIQAQTTLQSAMLRERAYQGAPAGKRSGGKSSANTIWGTIKIPEAGSANGHVPKGIRSELRAAFADQTVRPEPLEAKYALGMQSSISFTFGEGHGAEPQSSASPTGADFRGFGARGDGNAPRDPSASVPLIPQAYPKHLGVVPQVQFNSGPVALVSDRAPDAVMERRRRRGLHKILFTQNGPGGQPFNRKMLEGSLSEYAEERVRMTKLTGECHVPGDLRELAPPFAQLMDDPRDNSRITYAKEDPRFGSRQEKIDVGAYDCDFSLVRPRTTGYSPGHVRSVIFGATGSPMASRNMTAKGALNGENDAGRGGLDRSGSWGPTGGSSARSSTARRIDYCNDLHEALREQQLAMATSRLAQATRREHDKLSQEVKGGIDSFEQNFADRKAKGWKGV